MSAKSCIGISLFLLCAGVLIAESRENTPVVLPPPVPPHELDKGSSTAPGKTASENPMPAKQQDFGKGFSMLFQMGLPRPAAGARPAFIDIYSEPVSASNYGVNFGRSQLVGWIKIPENNTEPATCIIGGVFECKFYDQAALTKMEMEKLKKEHKNQAGRQVIRMIPERNYFSGKWKITTSEQIAADIRKLLQDKNKGYIFQSDKSKYGLLLLQAAQLYESGAKNEANEIAGTLFKAGGSKEVLQAAVNVLAEARYLRAYCDFIESKDWMRFNTDLEAITGKFKANCDNVRYIKALQAATAARVKNPEPPELKTSTPLSAEERELVVQLSKMSQNDYDNSGSVRRYGDFWLFQVNTDNDADQADENTDNVPLKTPGILDKIKNRGIKSIPLLIAMLDDEWLLPFKDRNGYSRRMNRGDDENEDNEQKTDKKQEISLSEAANHLEMPMTRGQLARKLLEPLIIPEDKEREYTITQKKSEEFKALCQAWYDSVSKLNAADLQKKYLSDGSEIQKSYIIRGMIAKADDTTAPMIEAALLDSDRNMMDHDLLIRYCEIRKDKAKPFIEKLRTKYQQQLDKQYSQQNVDTGLPKEKAKQDLDKFFDQLDQSKPRAALEDVAKEMLTLTNEQEFMLIARKFSMAAKGQPREKIYQICLDTAVTAKDPRQKLFLLYMLQMPVEDGQKIKQKTKLDIMKFKAQLEKLLDDQSVLPERFGGRQVIPLVAAGMIESMTQENKAGRGDDIAEGMDDLRGLYGHWDEKYSQYLIRRAKAILNNVPADKLPRLPDTGELKDVLINKAKAGIAGKSENEIKDLCIKAQLEDLIPLSAAVQQDKQLNAKLLPLANQITETDTGLPEIKDQLAKFKGRTLNEQTLQEILKLAESCLRNGRMVEGSLLRRPCMQGVIIKFSSAEDPAKGNRKIGVAGRNRTGMLSAHCMFGDSHGESMSRAVAIKSTTQNTDKNPDQALTENESLDTAIPDEDVKDQEKKFMEAFNAALKDGNALWAGKIIITAMSY